MEGGGEMRRDLSNKWFTTRTNFTSPLHLQLLEVLVVQRKIIRKILTIYMDLLNKPRLLLLSMDRIIKRLHSPPQSCQLVSAALYLLHRGKKDCYISLLILLRVNCYDFFYAVVTQSVGMPSKCS